MAVILFGTYFTIVLQNNNIYCSINGNSIIQDLALISLLYYWATIFNSQSLFRQFYYSGFNSYFIIILQAILFYRQDSTLISLLFYRQHYFTGNTIFYRQYHILQAIPCNSIIQDSTLISLLFYRQYQFRQLYYSGFNSYFIIILQAISKNQSKSSNASTSQQSITWILVHLFSA
jgi:hypothetical protein